MKPPIVSIILLILGATLLSAEDRLESLRGEIQNAEQHLVTLEEMVELHKRLENLTLDLNEATANQTSLRSKLQSLTDQIEAVEMNRLRKKALKEREAAIGEELGDFELPNGRRFEGASISKISDVGITIRHSSGSARISADDLPQKFRMRFMFDADLASKTLSIERDRASKIHSLADAAEREKKRISLEETSIKSNNVASQESEQRKITPTGQVTTRVVATGRAKIAASPEDLKTCVFVNITAYDITVGFSQYDARSYKEKFDHLKKLKITASSNVKSELRLNGTKVATIAPGKASVIIAVAAGRNGYEVVLESMDGKVLDLETNLRKTGL